jgi:hypothetical protein
MSSPGSVTVWIAALKAGNPQAAQRLWEGYFHKLLGLARQKLRGRPRTTPAGAEDVALDAFDSFCRGAAANRFPQLADHHDVWQLLVMLTARKAAKVIRHETREKRGGGKVQHVSALRDEDAEVLEVIGREPTPEFAAEVAEEFQRRLGPCPTRNCGRWHWRRWKGTATPRSLPG